MIQPRVTLYRGVVGSVAYGLARGGSDIDRLEVFAYPTDAFWHLSPLKESIGHQSPEHPEDYVRHEVAKFLRLALKCNPTLLELLWLPTEHVEVLTSFGQQMRDLRDAFLSTNYVSNAYGGYARQQLEKLLRRQDEGKEGFSSDTKRRTPKHARHCFRLLHQGRELMETGSLTVKVPNPEDYWAFDDMSISEIANRFLVADLEFRKTVSVLPSLPDFERVDTFLYGLRRSLLE